MFYRPENGHGLRRNPFNAIITPRPIGWISTTGPQGDNLAPYSFFNAVAYTPPQIMFASNGIKDSVRNIRETQVFAVNIVEEAMLHPMSETSAELPWQVDEFEHAGIPKAPCDTITCPAWPTPRHAGMPPGAGNPRAGRRQPDHPGRGHGHPPARRLRGGRLVRHHPLRPVARLGYRDYTVVRDKFTLARPGEKA